MAWPPIGWVPLLVGWAWTPRADPRRASAAPAAGGSGGAGAGAAGAGAAATGAGVAVVAAAKAVETTKTPEQSSPARARGHRWCRSLPLRSQHPQWFTKTHHDYPAADIPVPVGTLLYAVTNGVVVGTPTSGRCGVGLIFNGDDQAQYTYCHGQPAPKPSPSPTASPSHPKGYRPSDAPTEPDVLPAIGDAISELVARSVAPAGALHGGTDHRFGAAPRLAAGVARSRESCRPSDNISVGGDPRRFGARSRTRCRPRRHVRR